MTTPDPFGTPAIEGLSGRTCRSCGQEVVGPDDDGRHPDCVAVEAEIDAMTAAHVPFESTTFWCEYHGIRHEKDAHAKMKRGEDWR